MGKSSESPFWSISKLIWNNPFSGHQTEAVQGIRTDFSADAFLFPAGINRLLPLQAKRVFDIIFLYPVSHFFISPERGDFVNELDTLKRARSYLSAMAEGRNPLTGKEEPESSTLNEVRIARCLYYVVGVLDRVIANDGQVGVSPKTPKEKKPKRERSFALSDEQLCSIPAEPTAISISALLSKVNALIPEDMKKLSYRQTAAWLIDQGLMKEQQTAAGRTITLPTEAGEALGISRKQLIGKTGPYWGNLLNTDAQVFLLTHLPDIAAGQWIDPETGELLEESR